MEKVNEIKIIKNLEKEILQEVLNDSSGYFTFDEEIYPTSVVLRTIIDLVLLDVLQRNNQMHYKMFKKLKDSNIPENLYNTLEETIIDEFYGQTSEIGHEIVHFSIIVKDEEILKIIQDFILQSKIEDEIIETSVVDEFQKMNSYKDIKSSNINSFSAYADMEEEEWSQIFKEEGSIIFVEIQSFTNTIKNEVAGNFLNEDFGNSCTLMFDELTLSNKDLFVKQIYQDMLTYEFYLSNESINELFNNLNKL